MSMNDSQITSQMQYIGGLFFRRLHEELNDAEQAELDNWLGSQSPEDRRFFEEMTDWQKIQDALHYMYRIDVPAALADVQKKILYESMQAAPVVPIPRKTRTLSLKYAAAAAVIGLAIGGAAVYTLLNKKEDLSARPIAERFKNDVEPGADKATLQLADGSRILLDSAALGHLAKQGNTNIVKQDDGQISYQAAHKLSFSAPLVYNTLSTPRGGQFEVSLPDGSKVWLNAASSIRFPTAFSGKERKVELTGEAYFEVAKNESQPFLVSISPAPGSAAAPMQVQVLGTSFNVNAYADEDARRTTLVEGAVKIISGSEQSLLKPGEQARLTGATGRISVAADVDVDEVTAWRKGLFQFHEADIQSIMRQVSRWYNVDVVYDGKIQQQFIGKIPRRVQVSTLLKILESTGWVHFTIEGKKITVAP